MAPQRPPHSPPITRVKRARDGSSSESDKLPEELLVDILQRLPAKELCRLRTVCSSWRSLISDQAFIRAHADRHKEPLFLAKFRDDRTHVYVVDLCGNVVKRIAGADGGHQVLRTRLNLACLATERNTCRVLNPATGGIHQFLPVTVTLHNVSTFYALGLVASTGEYKLLRCLSTSNPLGFFGHELLSGVQVLSINGGTGQGGHAQWRPRPGPPLSIDVRTGAVVDGLVYFLTSLDYNILSFGVPGYYILSFDLEREGWRRVLLGSTSTGNPSGRMARSQLTLADLNGSLVLAHHPRSLSVMDLWFLLDFESRLWVKQYTIRTESATASLAPGYRLIPLLALDDGRLVIHLAPAGLLFICDPGTNTFTRVDMRHHLDSVGVYTGNLLSLQEGDMV